MVTILCIVIVVLLFIIFLQYHFQKKWTKHLFEIHEKLKDIVEQQTNEKLLFQTNKPVMQLFLIQINRLLDYNQKVIADYTKTKLELRKMLSNMSHDLKTPLTVILGYIEKINIDETMEESERKQITLKLYQKTKDIIVLINQFFDLAKLESKDHFLPLSRVHINEICRKNLIDFYELSKSKGLEVRAEIPDESFYILGNEEALNRILHNLISNAIRYGSDGNVLGLTLRTNDQYIAIEIWDQGKGIPETDQERVFERLYKLDDARHSSLQGSGLGLSITKRLVEEMRGTIYLKSVSHKKTIFTCEFKKMSY